MSGVGFIRSSSLVLAAAVSFAGCSHSTTHGDTRTPAQATGVLPDQSNWTSLYDFARNLNLADPSITLGMSGGGTSVYAVINMGGKSVGAVIPENSATVLSGEILSFNLARALGVSANFQPAASYMIAGESLRVFSNFIPRTPFRSAPKEENRLLILKRMKEHPEGIDATYKRWDVKPIDYDEIVNLRSETLSSTQVMSGSTNTMASMLRCDGPQPSASVVVTTNGGSASELDLAKQLSSILLIDALVGQWDRFSGGNLQLTKIGNAIQFYSFDNGGSGAGVSTTRKTLGLVTRFERSVAERVVAMDDFFTNGGNFQGVTNDAELLRAMDIERYPQALRNLKAAVKIAADQIRANPACVFN